MKRSYFKHHRNWGNYSSNRRSWRRHLLVKVILEELRGHLRSKIPEQGLKKSRFLLIIAISHIINHTKAFETGYKKLMSKGQSSSKIHGKGQISKPWINPWYTFFKMSLRLRRFGRNGTSDLSSRFFRQIVQNNRMQQAIVRFLNFYLSFLSNFLWKSKKIKP